MKPHLSRLVLAPLVGLCWAGCVLDSSAGTIDDSVDDPRDDIVERLREEIVGRWCGEARWVPSQSFFPSQTECIQIDFSDRNTYQVDCGCERPFPGEAPAAASGRYSINEATFNLEGFGLSSYEDNGETVLVDLREVRIEDDGLHMVRASMGYGLPITVPWIVELDLQRCDSRADVCP